MGSFFWGAEIFGGCTQLMGDFGGGTQLVDLHPQVGKMGGGNGVKNLKAIQGVTNRGGTPKKHKTPPQKKEVEGGP